jgi:hypothetical protein
MDLWRGRKLREYPEVVFEQVSDNARIHKNLLPYGLRIFLAQNRMFFGRRIAVDTPPWPTRHGQAPQKFFSSFQKSSATRRL